MPLRAPALLPRSVLARRRLTLREWAWVYQAATFFLLCFLSIGAVVGAGYLAEPFRSIGMGLGGATAVVFAFGGILSAFMQFDSEGESPRRRRKKIMAERARRHREHRGQWAWRELRGTHAQYGVYATRSGSEMEFRVLRYTPPYHSRLMCYLAPWDYESMRWDVSSERWSVEGKVLRVTQLDSKSLLEAYCEAAEVARTLEEQEVQEATKHLALDGIALAFTPPSRKTTNAEQLEAIRERVQVRRLLDAPVAPDTKPVERSPQQYRF